MLKKEVQCTWCARSTVCWAVLSTGSVLPAVSFHAGSFSIRGSSLSSSVSYPGFGTHSSDLSARAVSCGIDRAFHNLHKFRYTMSGERLEMKLTAYLGSQCFLCKYRFNIWRWRIRCDIYTLHLMSSNFTQNPIESSLALLLGFCWSPRDFTPWPTFDPKWPSQSETCNFVSLILIGLLFKRPITLLRW